MPRPNPPTASSNCSRRSARSSEWTRILWRLEREYVSGGDVEDPCFPGWEFLNMAIWTGPLLGYGGVAWGKLFDRPNATYGVHTGDVTFWNRQERTCLRISAGGTAGGHVATRFSRQPDGRFVLAHALTGERLATKRALRRFLRGRQDVWARWQVRPGRVKPRWSYDAGDAQPGTYERNGFYE